MTGYRWCPVLSKWLSPRGTVLPDDLQKDARFVFLYPPLPTPTRDEQPSYAGAVDLPKREFAQRVQEIHG